METRYIAIDLLDRYLAGRCKCPQQKILQTIAVTCALLALKLNEESDPDLALMLRAIPDTNHQSVTRESVMACEQRVLAALEWRLCPPTPATLAFALLDSTIPATFSHKAALVSDLEGLLMVHFQGGHQYRLAEDNLSSLVIAALVVLTGRIPEELLLQRLSLSQEHLKELCRHMEQLKRL